MEARDVRRVMVVAGAVFVAEAAAYSTVPPLLPHYREAFGLSKSGGGVLVGVYAAGLIPGSLLGERLANRAGVRQATAVGLVAFAVATAAFGFADGIAALDIARCVQGLAAGCMWGGALAWLLEAASPGREGVVIGTGLGFSIVGLLVGPAFGTLAVAVGTRSVFLLLGLVIASVGIAAVRVPGPPVVVRPRTIFTTFAALRDRRFAVGVWVTGFESALLGGVAAMVPALMAERGASSEAVGATFTLAAVIAFATSRAVGLITDRRGTLVVLQVGVLVATPLVLLMGLPSSPLMLAVLTVAAMATVMGGIMVPATALLVRAGRELRLTPASVTSIFLFTLAVGETVGSPAVTALGSATSNAVPFVVLALLSLLTFGFVTRMRNGPRPIEKATCDVGAPEHRGHAPVLPSASGETTLVAFTEESKNSADADDDPLAPEHEKPRVVGDDR